VVNNVNIQTAQQASDSITLNDPVISGIWGLAYNYPSSVEPSTTTFTSTLLPQLASEIITVDLKYHANGTYNFGALDTSRNTTAFNWIPLSDNASYWQASFGGFNVGGHNGTNYWLLHSWPVIFDTGTTLILLPDDLVAAYYNQINGSNTDPNYGGWTYECPDDYNQIPDLNIGFGDYVVNIPGLMMMYQQVSDLGGPPSSTGNKGPRCFGAIQSNAGLPFSIFGDALLKTQVAAFDFDGKRVGLAQKKLW
jgi:aspergillopepsin I